MWYLGRRDPLAHDLGGQWGPTLLEALPILGGHVCSSGQSLATGVSEI